MRQYDEVQDIRINAVFSDSPNDIDSDEACHLFCQHLKNRLVLPCEVTGIEDFQWEERYVFGPGDKDEYKHLKKTNPSYTDRYELLEIDKEIQSEWMMFWDSDIAARVKRISDGKEFFLGLSELRAIDKKTENYQLLDDYAVWFVNSR